VFDVEQNYTMYLNMNSCSIANLSFMVRCPGGMFINYDITIGFVKILQKKCFISLSK